MKIDVKVTPDLAEMMTREIEMGEIAVKRAMGEAEHKIKMAWRRQVIKAGLGRRLSNTIRGATYPKKGESLDAASLIWSTAPKLIGAFDQGVTIRASSGLYLAVPLLPAGKQDLSRKRITPAGFERKTGIKLRLVYRPNAPSLLVADDARIAKSGLALQRKGRRRRDGILTGATTVPVFLLLKQVRLKKRLDLERPVQEAHRRLPRLMVWAWEEEVRRRARS